MEALAVAARPTAIFDALMEPQAPLVGAARVAWQLRRPRFLVSRLRSTIRPMRFYRQTLQR